jgi:hypothetical protein
MLHIRFDFEEHPDFEEWAKLGLEVCESEGAKRDGEESGELHGEVGSEITGEEIWNFE